LAGGGDAAAAAVAEHAVGADDDGDDVGLARYAQCRIHGELPAVAGGDQPGA
jgi:hypothetical protein